jgi:hypothetical protein
MVNLCPAEANYLAVFNAEKESCWIKPRLVHSVFEICHCPVTLIGVQFKDFIVELEPGFAMNFGIKGDELVWVCDVRNLCGERTRKPKDLAH